MRSREKTNETKAEEGRKGEGVVVEEQRERGGGTRKEKKERKRRGKGRVREGDTGGKMTWRLGTSRGLKVSGLVVLQ